MPLTPLHFGPSATISIPLHKYLDVPVFLLINVAIDVEPVLIMLLNLNYPLHGFIHTFLFSSFVGVILAFIAYILKDIIQILMDVAHFPYEPKLNKMIAAGILGAFLHVFLDSIYHGDVQPFFPIIGNPFYGLIPPEALEIICIYTLILAFGLHFAVVIHDLYPNSKKGSKVEIDILNGSNLFYEL